MLTRRERTRDYTFLFNAIQKAVFQVINVEYIPRTLIADAAGSITRGFKASFGHLEKRVV